MRCRPRRLPALLAGALLALLAAPAQSLAVSQREAVDAATQVRGALTKAQQAGALPAGQAGAVRASLRSTMRVLRALDSPAKQVRHDELASQVLELAAIAQRGHLTPERLPALVTQLDANRVWFAAKGPPAALSRVTVGGSPIVYGYYPGHGLALQPLFNWTQANAYWFAHDYAGMQRLIDALAPLVVPQPGGWAAWEYEFDYGSGKAPWLSGMAQGVALQALARAWQATGDESDLELAQRLLPGFGIPTSSGGLLAPDGRMWWPLYAFDPGDLVLNGDLQTVISLFDYSAITGDQQALDWATRGAQTALAALPAYDTGAWSMYDQHSEADLGYHDLMTRQLGQLAVKSGLTGFRTYAQRFAAYRRTAPVVTPSAQTAPVVFYPWPRDGFLDTGTVAAQLDKRSSLVLTVLDASQTVVATERLGSFAHGQVQIGWDGRTGRGTAQPGTYTLAVRATDLAGNRSQLVDVGTVEVARDVTPPAVQALRVGRSATRQLRLRWAVSDTETPSVTLAVRVGNRSFTLRGQPLAGAATLPLRVPRKPFTAEIRIVDTSGNETTVTRHP